MSSVVLRLGDQGKAVKSLQAALFSHGFNPGSVDGEFGSGTEAACMAWTASPWPSGWAMRC